jgi:hypothetical protein
MKKIVLAFPSRESMAEFILECRLINVQTDAIYLTMTAHLDEECVDIAINKYGGKVSEAPDFILPSLINGSLILLSMLM